MNIIANVIQQQINTAKSGTGATTDVNSAVSTALNVVFSIVGIISVVMIVTGGVKYSTSQGDPGRVKSARSTILYGIIGLVVSLLAFAIVGFILKGL